MEKSLFNMTPVKTYKVRKKTGKTLKNPINQRKASRKRQPKPVITESLERALLSCDSLEVQTENTFDRLLRSYREEGKNKKANLNDDNPKNNEENKENVDINYLAVTKRKYTASSTPNVLNRNEISINNSFISPISINQSIFQSTINKSEINGRKIAFDDVGSSQSVIVIDDSEISYKLRSRDVYNEERSKSRSKNEISSEIKSFSKLKTKNQVLGGNLNQINHNESSKITLNDSKLFSKDVITQNESLNKDLSHNKGNRKDFEVNLSQKDHDGSFKINLNNSNDNIHDISSELMNFEGFKGFSREEINENESLSKNLADKFNSMDSNVLKSIYPELKRKDVKSRRKISNNVLIDENLKSSDELNDQIGELVVDLSQISFNNSIRTNSETVNSLNLSNSIVKSSKSLDNSTKSVDKSSKSPDKSSISLDKSPKSLSKSSFVEESSKNSSKRDSFIEESSTNYFNSSKSSDKSSISLDKSSKSLSKSSFMEETFKNSLKRDDFIERSCISYFKSLKSSDKSSKSPSKSSFMEESSKNSSKRDGFIEESSINDFNSSKSSDKSSKSLSKSSFMEETSKNSLKSDSFIEESSTNYFNSSKSSNKSSKSVDKSSKSLSKSSFMEEMSKNSSKRDDLIEEISLYDSKASNSFDKSSKSHDKSSKSSKSSFMEETSKNSLRRDDLIEEISLYDSKSANSFDKSSKSLDKSSSNEKMDLDNAFLTNSMSISAFNSSKSLYKSSKSPYKSSKSLYESSKSLYELSFMKETSENSSKRDDFVGINSLNGSKSSKSVDNSTKSFDKSSNSSCKSSSSEKSGYKSSKSINNSSKSLDKSLISSYKSSSNEKSSYKSSKSINSTKSLDKSSKSSCKSSSNEESSYESSSSEQSSYESSSSEKLGYKSSKSIDNSTKSLDKSSKSSYKLSSNEKSGYKSSKSIDNSTKSFNISSKSIDNSTKSLDKSSKSSYKSTSNKKSSYKSSSSEQSSYESSSSEKLGYKSSKSIDNSTKSLDKSSKSIDNSTKSSNKSSKSSYKSSSNEKSSYESTSSKQSSYESSSSEKSGYKSSKSGYKSSKSSYKSSSSKKSSKNYSNQDDLFLKNKELVVNLTQMDLNNSLITKYKLYNSSSNKKSSKNNLNQDDLLKNNKELVVDLTQMDFDDLITSNSKDNNSLNSSKSRSKSSSINSKNNKSKNVSKRNKSKDVVRGEIDRNESIEMNFMDNWKEPVVDLTQLDVEPLILKPGKHWRRSLLCQRRTNFVPTFKVIEEGLETSLRACDIGDKTVEDNDFEEIFRRTVNLSLLPEVEEEEERGGGRERESSEEREERDDWKERKEKKEEVKFLSGLTAKEVVLKRCGQKEILDFEECYPESSLKNCRKIGEGLYGEVFLLKKSPTDTSVLKIIPIEGSYSVNGEQQKTFAEILSEITIQSELSALRDNAKNRTSTFSQLKKLTCVRGRYPSRLTELWELYEEVNGTENDHPDIFSDEQIYIVLELANAGQDLESYVFYNSKQAFGVFKQVICALAVAESSLEFEHRDLHWGNVLVVYNHTNEPERFILDGKEITVENNKVKATIIDYTMSRIMKNGICIYNDIGNDPDLFAGQGDYQFDVYRLMRNCNGNNWEKFEPYSNVLWLNYILGKMIKGVHYRNTKTRVHVKGLDEMRDLQKIILKYKSVKQLVDSGMIMF